jgi:EAL domain-containing protein (putative c-di-GMP-specific phosphodiesterase class I)
VTTRIPDVERELWRALEQRSLTLHYQPIVDLHDATLGAAEALLRWRRDEGLVTAAAFLPDVADPALAQAISAFSLAAAAAQAATWRRRFPSWIFPVTVNVSANEFTDDLVDRVAHLRARHDLPSGALGVDLSEPLLLADAADVAGAAARAVALKAAGAQIFVDDFGTTHARRAADAVTVTRSTDELLTSVVALESFPIDVVKVDRELVERCFGGSQEARVIEGIVKVSHLAGFRILAEGVETGDEAETLRRSGFDLAQGYYFQRPHGPGHIDRLLHDLADAREAFSAPRPR